MRYTGPGRTLVLAALTVLAALAAGATPAQGASFTVNATHDAVDASPGDGVCADATGACTLRAAVMETNALAGADEIFLPAGTYALSIPGAGEDASATGDLDVTDDLTIGGVVIVNGAPEPQTTVDGGGLDRVFHVRGAGNLALIGLIVQGGTSSMSPAFGGGIYNESADLQIVYSEIRANSSSAFGGGVFAGANSINTISTSSITGNTAREGGGIFTVSGASTTVQYASIKDNVAVLTGGGIANGGFATLSLLNTAITGNSAGVSGGGIANFGGATVVGATIAMNDTSAGGAGGVYAGGGSLSMAQSSIVKNGWTGLINGVSGGDPPPPPTPASLVNVTIAENLGGIFVEGNGELTARNTTVGFNDAFGILTDDFGVTTLLNTIVGYNGPSGDDCSGEVTSLGHNLDSDGSCSLAGAGDLSDVEPLLVPLPDDIGAPQVLALPRGGCPSDACIPFSPAIDAADNSACPPIDQRGQPRPFDGDGNGSADCDIGAYELSEPPFTCPSPCGFVFVTPTPTVAPIPLPRTGGAGEGSGFPLAAVAIGVAAIGVIGGGVALSRRAVRRG